MNVYIVADMEGIGGIVLREQVLRGSGLYEEGRRLLTNEVNAAVEGAFRGGATRVVIKDAHGSGFNFVPEEVDPRAEVAAGATPERLAGLDASFAGVVLVGYHARAGTLEAVCAHTMSSASWERYELCGREVGEVGIDAALAGTYGVPVIAVTGDDKVCVEAAELLGPGVVTCSVKRGLGLQSAVLLPPSRAREAVAGALAEGVSRALKPAPYAPPPPYEARLTYQSAQMAQDRLATTDAALSGERTLVFGGSNLREVIQRSLG